MLAWLDGCRIKSGMTMRRDGGLLAKAWIPAFAGMAGSYAKGWIPAFAGMAGSYEPATFILSIRIDPTVFAP